MESHVSLMRIPFFRAVFWAAILWKRYFIGQFCFAFFSASFFTYLNFFVRLETETETELSQEPAINCEQKMNKNVKHQLVCTDRSEAAWKE